MQLKTIIRSDGVQKLTGLSRSTLWRLERSKRFPRRFQVGDRAVGWLDSEVQDWITAKHLSGGTLTLKAGATGDQS